MKDRAIFASLLDNGISCVFGEGGLTSAISILAFAESGDNILAPDGSLFLIIVLFLILVPILNRILFKPVTDVLNKRERLTGGSRHDTVSLLHEIDEKLAGYEEGIRAARSEGYKLIEGRRKQAGEERQGAIQAARDHAASQIADARLKLGAEAEAARTKLQTEARDIATQISTNLLGRAVGGKK